MLCFNIENENQTPHSFMKKHSCDYYSINDLAVYLASGLVCWVGWPFSWCWPPSRWVTCFVWALSIRHFLSLDILLLPLRLWHLNNLCSLEFCSTLLLWTWFVINFLSAANSEMYEMFCVVISGLTFVWVLSADPGIAWLLSRLHSRNYRWVPNWVRVA